MDGSSWSVGSRSSNMNSISSETLSRITWGSMKTTLGRMSRKYNMRLTLWKKSKALSNDSSSSPSDCATCQHSSRLITILSRPLAMLRSFSLKESHHSGISTSIAGHCYMIHCRIFSAVILSVASGFRALISKINFLGLHQIIWCLNFGGIIFCSRLFLSSTVSETHLCNLSR